MPDFFHPTEASWNSALLYEFDLLLEGLNSVEPHTLLVGEASKKIII